jgi:hypothetical protein
MLVLLHAYIEMHGQRNIKLPRIFSILQGIWQLERRIVIYLTSVVDMVRRFVLQLQPGCPLFFTQRKGRCFFNWFTPLQELLVFCTEDRYKSVFL